MIAKVKGAAAEARPNRQLRHIFPSLTQLREWQPGRRRWIGRTANSLWPGQFPVPLLDLLSLWPLCEMFGTRK